MKKLICGFILVFGFIFGTAGAFAKGCNEIVFYGKTINHKKEVMVCLIGLNNLRYTFGKVGDKQPELALTVSTVNSSWGYHYDDVTSIAVVNVADGDISYSIYSGINEDGKAFSSIVVYEDFSRIAKISLDTTSVYNNINVLRDTGVPEINNL